MSDKPTYEDLEKRIEDLNTENRTLKQTEERNIALNHLAESLLNPSSLNEKMKLITDRGVDIFAADFFRIWITKPGDLCNSGCIHSDVEEGPHVCQNRNRCLHLIASSGRYTHIDGKIHRRVPLGCYKIGRVASGRDPKFMTNDVAHDPQVHDHEWAKKLGLVSFVGYRLLSNTGDRIGVMALFAKHPISPNADAALEGLANMTSQTIQATIAEEELRESQEQYRNIVIMNPDPMAIVQDDSFQLVSRAFTELFGYTQEEVDAGLEPISIVQDHEKEMIDKHILNRSAAKGMASKPIRLDHATKDGTLIPCETSGVAIDYNGRPAILATIRDISERIKAEQDKDRLQAQLQQAQKMEAIGTLAGGIAHDFNNILGVIVGNNELAMDDIPDCNPVRHNLEEVHNACLKARDLVKQILAFSRQTSQIMKPVEIGSLITESLKLLRSSFPTTIEIRQDITSRSDIVNADPTQINQVLLNLCTNASHAMEDAGGILEIRLKNIVLNEADAARFTDMRAGNYARLTVSDTGHGIDAETIDRIFDPYFTTKALGKGTGMGLAVVHGIVKNHGGHISVYSKPGEGTTFHVYFPVIEEEVKPDIGLSETLPTGTERILFVDDDESIVKVGEKMLRRLGYKTETSTNPIEALEFFRAVPNRYDLVITDMTMPNMTGDKLAQELMKVRPDIPIILFTGHSERMSEEKAKSLGIQAFLMKPVIQPELARIIRKVLDKG